jgi:tRNA (guanine26-N2/guanine27-N2)-dimethyltransferase
MKEGKAEFALPKKVFYNPAMKENRDISVSLLNSVADKNLQIALPLAASGVRGIRFLKELGKQKIKSVSMNDLSRYAAALIKKNLKLNRIKSKVKVCNKDANQFLLDGRGFDYIDIDPFGSPCTFLDSAVKRISRGGILAVTATDTGALSGTFENACQRKYWAKPLLNELKHELGLRILIRRIQLIGAEHDKALIPVYSHSTLHYMRAYFRCRKGKQEADRIIKQHKYLLYCPKCMFRRLSDFNIDICCDSWMDYAGPLWQGDLWDSRLAAKIAGDLKSKLTETIASESKINAVGFYDLHTIAKVHKKKIPKTAELIAKIMKKKKKSSVTHFLDTGIRTDMDIKELLGLF